MEQVLAQQCNQAEPITGKAFFFGVLGVLIRLALAQILVNFLIAMTGVGLINLLFYLYAIVLLLRFMGKTVAGSQYMLKENRLILQKQLGDSTVSAVEIPTDQILSIRPVFRGDRLACSYRRVSVIDASAAQPARMRIAFGAALVSAWMARNIAGDMAYQAYAYAVVYLDEGIPHICVFRPDEAFLSALRERFPQAFGMDERREGAKRVTLWLQALERAFPQLYTHVEPLVSEERVRAAKAEIKRQKQEKDKRKGKQKPVESQDTSGEDNEEEAGRTDEVQDDTL